MSARFISEASKFTITSNEPFEVKARDATIQRLSWVLTEPVDVDLVERKNSSINLTTESHHQGWVDQPNRGSFSWFELAIVVPYAEIDGNGRVAYDYVKKADKTLSWVSHHHPVNQSGKFETFSHQFPKDHEIWKYLQVGDRLAVFGCAQYANWSCVGRYVELKIEVPDGFLTQDGTVIAPSKTRAICIFEIDGYDTTFDMVLTPAVQQFKSSSATIVYRDADHLNGTMNYDGYIGKSDFKFELKNKKGNVIATISGQLVTAMESKNHVLGTGTWMTS